MARLTRAMALAGGAALVALMLLTVVDVALRAVFNAPIFGVQEITEVGLVLVTVLGIAHCGWTGAHIAIDFIGSALPPRLLRVNDTVVQTVGAAAMGVVAWRSLEEGLDAAARGASTNVLGIPQVPFYVVVAIGFAAYAAVLVAQAALRRPAQGERA